MARIKSNKLKIATMLSLSTFTMMQFYLGSIAQEEILSAPLPGSMVSKATVKVQEINHNTQPAMNNPENDREKSIFLLGMSSDKYPISVNGLRTLIEKYKEEASASAYDTDNIDSILIWIDELIKAHNRITNSFVKQVDLKSAYENECNLIRQLRAIKNEILYLKVQALIKAKKLKQAIPILIDITCSEPNSVLGLKAYQHLKQSGFSSEINITTIKQSDDKANKENNPLQ